MSRCLDGYDEIIVLTDNDEKDDGSNPGQELAKRIMSDLPEARNVLLPPGIDANKFVVTHGRDALVELLGLEVM
jgi:5S rRNA maturation endonuclease (ribonuclease M5)